MAGRDSKGRFTKGNNCATGRPKKPDELRGINQKTIPELVQIAFDQTQKVDVRVGILKWLTEMDIGKPQQRVDMEAKTTGEQIVRFEGELAEWAQ